MPIYFFNPPVRQNVFVAQLSSHCIDFFINHKVPEYEHTLNLANQLYSMPQDEINDNNIPNLQNLFASMTHRGQKIILGTAFFLRYLPQDIDELIYLSSNIIGLKLDELSICAVLTGKINIMERLNRDPIAYINLYAYLTFAQANVALNLNFISDIVLYYDPENHEIFLEGFKILYHHAIVDKNNAVIETIWQIAPDPILDALRDMQAALLTDAASAGQMESVKFLLELIGKTSDDNSGLMSAVIDAAKQNNHQEIVEYLQPVDWDNNYGIMG